MSTNGSVPLEQWQAVANAKMTGSSSRSRSTTSSSSRHPGLEPSRSRSRPRTTVADALAGRIPVGMMGTPAARSNSASRGLSNRVEGAFVRDIMRHGAQPSVDIKSSRSGGLDSAAASAENVVGGVGVLEAGGRMVEADDSNSSISMESSSTASAAPSSVGTTRTTPKSSRRWRWSLSPTRRLSKPKKTPKRSSASSDDGVEIRLACHEPPDSNFRTRAVSKRRAREEARQAALRAADEAAAAVAAENVRAAWGLQQDDQDDEDEWSMSNTVSSRSRGGGGEREGRTNSELRLAEENGQRAGGGKVSDSGRSARGRTEHILARKSSHQHQRRGAGSSDASTVAPSRASDSSSSALGGDGQWPAPPKELAPTKPSAQQGGETRRQGPRLEQPHEAAVVTARARSRERKPQRGQLGRGVRPGSEGRAPSLLPGGGPWPHWTTLNTQTSGRSLLVGTNDNSANGNLPGPSPASSVASGSWQSLASFSASSSSSSGRSSSSSGRTSSSSSRSLSSSSSSSSRGSHSSSSMSTSSSLSSHRPTGWMLHRSSSSVSSARGSSLLGYGGPLPSPVLEGSESSGSSASSATGRRGSRRNGSKGFERPVRNARKPANKKPPAVDAEEEPPTAFTGAWSGDSGSISSPPRGGRSDIPRSPASHLVIALKRDEALEREQAEEVAAVAAAAVGAAAAAAASAAAAAAADAKPVQGEVNTDSSGSRRGRGSGQTRVNENRGTEADEEIETSSLFSSDYFSADEGEGSTGITTKEATSVRSTLDDCARVEGSPAGAAVGEVIEEPTPKLDRTTVEAHLLRSFSSEGTSSSSNKSTPTLDVAPISTVAGDEGMGGDGGNHGGEVSCMDLCEDEAKTVLTRSSSVPANFKSGEAGNQCSPWVWDNGSPQMLNHSIIPKGMFTDCVGNSTSETPIRSAEGVALGDDNGEQIQTNLPQPELPAHTVDAAVVDDGVPSSVTAMAANLELEQNQQIKETTSSIVMNVTAGMTQEDSQNKQQEKEQAALFQEQLSDGHPSPDTIWPSAPQGWASSALAARVSPQTSPPQLEQLSQKPAATALLQQEQPGDSQRQKGGQVTTELSRTEDQTSPRSFVAQLSQRIAGRQQSTVFQSKREEASSQQVEAVALPRTAQESSDHLGEQTPDEENRSMLASPAEPVGLALLPQEPEAPQIENEQRSPSASQPGRSSLLSQISQRLENLQRRTSPSPPPAATGETVVEEVMISVKASAAAAAVPGAVTVIPPSLQPPEQRQQVLRPTSRSQLQQLSARLDEHFQQQQRQGELARLHESVPMQQQTPPPRSPRLPTPEEEESNVLLSASAMPAVLAPEASSSSLSFSPDEWSPDSSTPIFHQISGSEQEKSTVLVVSGQPQPQPPVPQPCQPDPSAEATLQATVQIQTQHAAQPQPQVQTQPTAAAVAAVATPSPQRDTASPLGSSPEDAAQPKSGETTARPRTHTGLRLLPTPEQLAARRLLQLPPPQPNQAALQLRLAEQPPSEETPQESSGSPSLPPLQRQEQLLELRGKLEEEKDEQAVQGQGEHETEHPMRQIHDALLLAQHEREKHRGDPVGREGEQRRMLLTRDAADAAQVGLETRAGLIQPQSRECESVLVTPAGRFVEMEEDKDGMEAAQQHQQQRGTSSVERNMREFGGQKAAEEARAATKVALATVAEEAAAAAAAAAAAVGLTGDYAGAGAMGVIGRSDSDSSDGGPPLEQCSLITAQEQKGVRVWLSEGVMVKKWTSGGSGTRRRKLRLERVAGGKTSGIRDAPDPMRLGTMLWAAWAKAGEVESGGAEGDGEDGLWKLVVLSEKSKDKDIVHRLSNLREVTENNSDKGITLAFEGGGEPEGKFKAAFPTQQPVVRFFRQVADNRKRRELVSQAAKACLVALEKGAIARAAAATAQDVDSRWETDGGMRELEEACRNGDVIETQPSCSILAAVHIKDAKLAQEELEGIVGVLVQNSKHGIRARPMQVMSDDDMELESLEHFDGDVRRVLNAVQMSVVCRGPKEAAQFCRELKAHPQVKAVMWNGIGPEASSEGSRQAFQAGNAFVHLKGSDHVVQIQLRREMFLGTAGVDYKSLEWARGLKAPVMTGAEPCLRFDGLRMPVKERMLALVRQDWMGLRCMLPQLLEAMGKAEEAENLLRQTDAEERALRHLAESHDEDKSGDDETAEATATAASACAMSDLAMVLQEQGKLTEAEELFRKALAMRIEVLGPDHPCVGLSASNLAGVLRDQGRREEATAELLSTMKLPFPPTPVSSHRFLPTPPRRRREDASAASGNPNASQAAAAALGSSPACSSTTSAGSKDGDKLRASLVAIGRHAEAMARQDSSSSSFGARCAFSPMDTASATAAAAAVAAAACGGDSGGDDGGVTPERESEREESIPGRPTMYPPVPSPPLADFMVDDRADPKTLMESPETIGYASSHSLKDLAATAVVGGTLDATADALSSTGAAVAAAVTAISAGENAKTARFALASARASAHAVMEPRVIVSEARRENVRGNMAGGGGGEEESREEWMSEVEEKQREYEARASIEQDAVDVEWELAHSVAVANLNNLAVLLSEQGDAEQAEAFHRRALRAREMVHGPNHPDVPILLSNLAGTLYVQGKDSEAQPLHEKALHIREALLGSRHPDVATSLEFLTRMALRRGRTFVEMEELVSRLVDAREACLTKNNAPPAIEGRRQVGSVMSDLALALRRQPKEQAKRAFPLFRRVFLSDEKILGSYHALVAEDVVNLAEVMTAQGNLANAEELHRRALKIRQYTLGEEHPSTLASLRHLGIALRDQGKTHAGELLLRRAGQIRAKSRGSGRFQQQEGEGHKKDIREEGSPFQAPTQGRPQPITAKSVDEQRSRPPFDMLGGRVAC